MTAFHATLKSGRCSIDAIGTIARFAPHIRPAKNVIHNENVFECDRTSNEHDRSYNKSIGEYHLIRLIGINRD